jgi:hypothetical protein
MENVPASHIEERIRSAFTEDAIERVQVLAYGDDPEVGPGETAVRVLLGRAGRPEGREDDKEIIGTFTDASGHHETLRRLSDELPSVAWIDFRPYVQDESTRQGGPFGTGPSIRFRARGGRAGDCDEPQEQALTPVMTRLGAADLAAVDTLIAAGIAGSRAEILRWAVSRIREHPAYAQLQDRVREIGELKAQFLSTSPGKCRSGASCGAWPNIARDA